MRRMGEDDAHVMRQPAHLMLYGSLMRAAGDLLERLGAARRLAYAGRCCVEGRLHDLGAYPALTPGNGLVHGELYRVLDPRVFEVLDPYEDFFPATPERSMYLRRALLLQNPPLSAWVYVYNLPTCARPRIGHGDWLRHLEQRSAQGHQQ